MPCAVHRLMPTEAEFFPQCSVSQSRFALSFYTLCWVKLRVFKRLAIGAVGNRTYGGRMSRSGDCSYRRRNFWQRGVYMSQ